MSPQPLPVGIITKDTELRKKFEGTPEHAQNYLSLLAEEARELLAQLGFRTTAAMTGRVAVLEVDPDAAVPGLDFEALPTPARRLRANACRVRRRPGPRP